MSLTTSWIPHDRGGFLLPPPSHCGGDGWLRVIQGVIMVVRGGYLLPHHGSCLNSSSEQLPFLARVSPMGCGAFFCLSRQVSLLNYMGWKIESSCYWTYAIYFWALVQSTK
ncbi:hypothetical protein QL285_004471 [Trifolium repens]|nr:hypothetical protein QL285_004471 [Trifolium repens]